MATTNPLALLKRLLQEPREREWLEFKVANADPDLIGRTLCACANAAMLSDQDRGYLVWGIENKTKKRVGTTIRLQAVTKGAEPLYNWLSHLIEPRLMMEVLDFEDGGKLFSILAIEPTYDRPVRFSGTEYVRIGDQVKPLKDFPDHERSLWLATGRRKFENAIALPHQTPEEVISKLDMKTYYSLCGKSVPTSQAEKIRQFAERGFIHDDMQGGFDITNLGALLFADDVSVFPSITSKAVRVIQYSGKDKSRSEKETRGQKGYAVGFKGVLGFTMGRLPQEEKIVDGIRKSISRYSQIAIREIVANALIHQDFTISGAGPVIEIYSDRIEVTSPGNSLIERDRIIDERRSRNERLASAMRELGICEERGGGIDKAIIDIEEMFLPAPEFHYSANQMRVVIFGPKTFRQLSKSERTWSCFCHCVVRWLRHDPMSNATLRRRFALPDDEYTNVSGVISDARKAGMVKPLDPKQGKKNARYVPHWS